MYVTLLSLMLAVSVSLMVYAAVAGQISRQSVIRGRLDDSEPTYDSSKPSSGPASGAWLKKSAAPALAKMIRPKSEKEQTRLRVKLAQAGFRGESTLILYLAGKIFLGLVGMVLFFIVGTGKGCSAQTLFGLTGVGGGLGFLLPDLWLYLVAKSRQEKIVQSLPDCLDLMVICVEAGLGLDAAMQRVSQEMASTHRELSEEFSLVNHEVQMGLMRSDALSNLAMRTGVSEIKSMAALLIQAERFGTSIAAALRIHADFLRVKRSQAAEERAAKTTVKLIFPLLFFIFPSIFVVLGGPAIMKLWENLGRGRLG
jgi:tight adherence protein C